MKVDMISEQSMSFSIFQMAKSPQVLTSATDFGYWRLYLSQDSQFWRLNQSINQSINRSIYLIFSSGTDAYIYLKTVSSDASELLPIFNKTTSRYYKTNLSQSDWSSPVPGSSWKKNNQLTTLTVIP